MTGLLAVIVVALLVGAAMTGLALQAGDIPLARELAKPYTLSIIRFTLWQAGLSTALSIALAIPLARALHRRQHFFGRGLLVRLTSISLIVPTMVAILGIIAVHGRGGWVNDLLQALGFTRVDYLYGLNGILIAHVFFNLPLVSRILLVGLGDIPAYQWRLAALYGFRPSQVFRYIEWPVLRRLIPGAAGIVFLLCFTSFAIVLTLGGGPRASTLEVAIYQAVRFDFDLPRAVALSIIQIGICLFLAMLFFARQPTLGLGAEHAGGGGRPDADQGKTLYIDTIVILAAAIFLLSPFAGILTGTLDGKGWGIVSDDRFWQAATTSVTISISAGLLATGFGLAIAHLIARLRSRAGARWLGTIPEVVGMMTMLMPPITLGTGLFLLVRKFTDILSAGYFLVVAVNALFTLAFTLRVLVPSVSRQQARFTHLSQSLGIRGFNLWRLVFWPTMKKPLCYALAISTALAAGDMGVIALFGTDALSTLPLLIYRLLGSYRLEQAAVAALGLCLLCYVLFWLIERLADLPSGRTGAANA